MTESSSPKTYSLLVVLLLFVCIFAVYTAATNYWPAYTLAKARLVNAQAENDRAKKALESSVAFLADFQDQEANAALLNLALPKRNSDMANFVSSLSGLAGQSGMTLTNFAINTGAEINSNENAIKSEDLSVTVSGMYLAFKDLMLRLEEHLRVIDVYHVTLSAGGTTGVGALPLTYSLKLRTYYQQ